MKNTDSQKTIEIIERLKLAKIGDYKKWETLSKKISDGLELNGEEYLYISRLASTYKNEQVYRHTKIYHSKLSNLDKKPPCKTCGTESLFYCNMNDAYFCSNHVVGHDENEI